MELKIPSKFKDVLDQNSALSGLVHTSINEFGEWLKQNNVKFFTEYTDHSLEHVENVLQTAHDLIRDECKAFITPHDVATLILATLLHDSAMHISEDGFAHLVTEDLDSTINGFGDKPWKRLWADFLAESRRFSGRQLIALFGDAEPVRHPPLDDLQQLNGIDLLLCGEFLRRHHSRLAHEIAIFGVPGPSERILKLLATDDTSHVVDLAGLVARSHGLSIRECFEYLQTHYSSVKLVRGIHPTFLMALLRIADILQIQSSRAPKQVLKVRQLKSPISSGEWEMHQAIKDVNTNEYVETIWVDARPENVKTYLRIRNQLDQIQSEPDLAWTVIGEVYGYTPEFREFGLKIRRIRSNIDDIDTFSKHVPYIPTHASFEVADTDLLNLLIGPLYGEKAEIGIRELMQNALDAVNELNEFQKHLKYQDLDLTDQEGDVVISIDQKEDGEWWLTISDRGIGMTINTVKEYFLKAGASLRRSEIWKKTFEDEEGKSKILRSGRFGIGALAAFLVGDEIKVTTRHVSSRNNQGVEFSAQIDTEAVELKHINRPVGTTVIIKMKEEAVKSLVPSIDETKLLLKRKENKWDWYCLNNPSVLRRMNQAPLQQRETLPELNSKLPFGWHRIKHPDFEDIHWTYMPYLPNIVCNGIVVQTDEATQSEVKDEYIKFQRPALSIFDFNANLPLNIQRTDFTTTKLSFAKNLLENIIRDYITFLLVEAPTRKFPSPESNQQNFKPWYYGGVADSNPHSNGLLDIPPYFLMDSGVGLFNDPGLFSELGQNSILAVFTDEDVSPELTTLKNESLLWIPVRDYFWIPKLRVLYSAIEAGLGLSTHLVRQEEEFVMPLAPYGHVINSSRLLVSKQLIKAIESFKDYYPITPDILKYLDKPILPFFSHRPSLDEFRSKRLENTITISTNWEDENWVMLNYGECPESDFDFEKFAKTYPYADYKKWPCVIAEWYLGENPKKNEESVLEQIWNEIIRSPVIPYDLIERKKKLIHAYQELAADIENYEETRQLIESEKMKRQAEE